MPRLTVRWSGPLTGGHRLAEGGQEPVRPRRSDLPPTDRRRAAHRTRPPRRAHVSAARTEAWSRRAHSSSSRSPAASPRLSLTRLKPSSPGRAPSLAVRPSCRSRGPARGGRGTVPDSGRLVSRSWSVTCVSCCSGSCARRRLAWSARFGRRTDRPADRRRSSRPAASALASQRRHSSGPGHRPSGHHVCDEGAQAVDDHSVRCAAHRLPSRATRVYGNCAPS